LAAIFNIIYIILIFIWFPNKDAMTKITSLEKVDLFMF
jgi:hypothetical protein